MKKYWVQFGLKAQDQTQGVFARVNKSLLKMKQQAGSTLMNAAQGGMGMLQSIATGLPSVMSLTGGLSSIALSAGAAGAAVTAMTINDFGPLDLTFRKIKAVAPDIAGSMDELRQATAQLSDSSKFRQGEIAAGYLELAKQGFKANEIIGAMPGLLDLASAAEVDLAQATELAAGTLRGFGMQASMTGKVADVLAMAASASAADIPDIGLALSYITPIAKQGNQTLEEMGAVIALLSNNMVKGEKAGTGVRGMITKLAAPSKAAAKELKRLGIQVTDGSGKMRPLLDITNDLSRATSGMTDAQRIATMETLVGLEGITALGVLMNQNAQAVQAMRDQMALSGGEAKRMGNEMNTGVVASSAKLGKSFENVRIQLGRIFEPTVMAGLDLLTSKLDAANRMLQAMPSIDTGSLGIAPGESNERARVALLSRAPTYRSRWLAQNRSSIQPQGSGQASFYADNQQRFQQDWASRTLNFIQPKPMPPQKTDVSLTVKVKGENGAKGTVAGVQTQGHPVNVSVLGFMGTGG